MNWGEFVSQTWGGKLLAPILNICACFYNLIVTTRNIFFDYGLLKQTKVSVPVISLGNITTGGTGKTPAAIWLVQQIQQVCSRRPVLISRGYGQDEMKLFAQKLPNVPHYIHHRRVIAAQQAITELGENIILVLDDGFQHRYLARTADIVLIDATCPDGFGAPLPRGLLRETLSSLRRATWIIITRSDQVAKSELSNIQNRIAKYTSAPQLLASHLPCSIHPLAPSNYPLAPPNESPAQAHTTQSPTPNFSLAPSNESPAQAHTTQSPTPNFSLAPSNESPAQAHTIYSPTQNTSNQYPLSYLQGQLLLPVAGIANPASFYATLQSLSYTLLPLLAFSDHHAYSKQDVKKIVLHAQQEHAHGIITTAKDAVKLESYFPTEIPIWVLDISFQVYDANQNFLKWLCQFK